MQTPTIDPIADEMSMTDWEFRQAFGPAEAAIERVSTSALERVQYQSWLQRRGQRQLEPTTNDVLATCLTLDDA